MKSQNIHEKKLRPWLDLNLRSVGSESVVLTTTPCLGDKTELYYMYTREKASQCGYVVGTSAFCQGDLGSNPILARKSCEVYPGLGILQPQWNPYPTL